MLLEAARSIEAVLDEPPPAVVLAELADSSVNWAVRVWAKSTDFWAVKDRLTESVKNALDRAGIGIPYPQMDVHVRTATPPPAFKSEVADISALGGLAGPSPLTAPEAAPRAES